MRDAGGRTGQVPCRSRAGHLMLRATPLIPVAKQCPWVSHNEGALQRSLVDYPCKGENNEETRKAFPVNVASLPKNKTICNIKSGSNCVPPARLIARANNLVQHTQTAGLGARVLDSRPAARNAYRKDPHCGCRCLHGWRRSRHPGPVQRSVASPIYSACGHGESSPRGKRRAAKKRTSAMSAAPDGHPC